MKANKCYLGAFKKESVPDMEVSVDWEILNKQTQEPVEREEGRIHSVRL